MSPRSREIIEAVLFLPAMALLAGVIFGGMYAVILFGNWALFGWFDFMVYDLHLPRPLAFALSIFATALTVYGAVQAIGRIEWRRLRFWSRRKA